MAGKPWRSPPEVRRFRAPELTAAGEYRKHLLTHDAEAVWRDENVIDRSSGELTPFRYELGRDITSYPLLSQGWDGKSVDLDYEYDCQKPKR